MTQVLSGNFALLRAGARRHLVQEQTFQVGSDVFVAEDAPGGHRSAFFEDDGETGYFYAVDLTQSDNLILDAVHIYNVASVVDKNRPSKLSIVWSDDGLKCALLINKYPHAAFDFAKRKGFCRTDFPSNSSDNGWSESGHQWSDDAVAWLKLEGKG